MLETCRKTGDWLALRRRGVLAAAIGLYVLVFAAICLWKYRMFAYDGIDLGFFSQVFWNTLHGRWFATSVHPQLSLGDHAELAIPLLTPLYALLAGGPPALLILQTAALALAAWPLCLIAERRLAGLPGRLAALLPLFFGLAWLLSPFVQNINLYEFHVLPFALLPLFFAILEYERGRKARFLAFAVLALLVREDVALVIAMIGVLAWLEKRPKFWQLAPIALGGAWFLGAMALISRYAPAGGYKYAIYYAWLGGTPAAMVWNAVRHPLSVLRHVLTLANLEMVLGFGLPLTYLPFLRPKRLVLALGPLLQIVLGAPGGGELVLRTHYAVLFLPALFLAAVEGFKAMPALATKAAAKGLPDAPVLIGAVLAVSLAYGGLWLGPVPSVLARLAHPGDMAARAAAAREMVARIPPDASVAAGYALLPALSSRENLYSLHYQFLGVNQFALKPYVLPADTRFLAMDTSDLVTYGTQFPRTAWAAPHYAGGFARLRAAAGPIAFSRGNFVLYDRQAGPGSDVAYMTYLSPPARQSFRQGIRLIGAGAALAADDRLRTPILKLTTAWAAAEPPAKDLVMRVRLLRQDREVAYDGDYPLANGLVPTSELGESAVTGELDLPLFGLGAGRYFPLISLEDQDAYLSLDAAGSMVRVVEARRSAGEAVLPAFELSPAR